MRSQANVTIDGSNSNIAAVNSKSTYQRGTFVNFDSWDDNQYDCHEKFSKHWFNKNGCERKGTIFMDRSNSRYKSRLYINDNWQDLNCKLYNFLRVITNECFLNLRVHWGSFKVYTFSMEDTDNPDNICLFVLRIFKAKNEETQFGYWQDMKIVGIYLPL